MRRALIILVAHDIGLHALRLQHQSDHLEIISQEDLKQHVGEEVKMYSRRHIDLPVIELKHLPGKKQKQQFYKPHRNQFTKPRR